MNKHFVLRLALSAALCFALHLSALCHGAEYGIIDLGVDGRSIGGVALNDNAQTIIGLDMDFVGDVPPILFNDGSSIVNVRPLFPHSAILTESGELFGTVPAGDAESVLRRYSSGAIEEVDVIGYPSVKYLGVNSSLKYFAVVDAVANSFSITGQIGSEAVANLGSLGGSLTLALDINDSGTIVGLSNTGEAPGSGNVFQEAFVYEAGSIQGLGTLGGISSMARGINNAGTIVGESQVTINGPVHAFVYDSVSGMRGIGMPGLHSAAIDINESGVIVGSAERTPDVWRAARLDEHLGIQFLEDLIPRNSGWESLFRATDINNSGQVVGLGLIYGEMHAFLLTPTPEPSTFGLLLPMGMLIAGIVRYRRTQR